MVCEDVGGGRSASDSYCEFSAGGGEGPRSPRTGTEQPAVSRGECVYVQAPCVCSQSPRFRGAWPACEGEHVHP